MFTLTEEAIKNHRIKRTTFVWGTYGKDSNHSVQWIRLMHLSDDHIRAILCTEIHLSVKDRNTLMYELEYRKISDIFIPDVNVYNQSLTCCPLGSLEG